MSLENIISIEPAQETLDTVQAAVQTASDSLAPFLVSLTPEQRKELPKMSDKSTPFVEKALSYAASEPKLFPAYLDVEELKKDVNAVAALTTIYRSLAQLTEQLNDTITLAGSEAYVAALAFYNSVKQAAKMNVPGAKTIYDDLKKRFDR